MPRDIDVSATFGPETDGQGDLKAKSKAEKGAVTLLGAAKIALKRVENKEYLVYPTHGPNAKQEFDPDCFINQILLQKEVAFLKVWR